MFMSWKIYESHCQISPTVPHSMSWSEWIRSIKFIAIHMDWQNWFDAPWRQMHSLTWVTFEALKLFDSLISSILMCWGQVSNGKTWQNRLYEILICIQHSSPSFKATSGCGSHWHWNASKDMGSIHFHHGFFADQYEHWSVWSAID